MSERGEELAARLDRQISELAGVLSGLSESDLRAASQDPKAPTTGDLLDHLLGGTALVIGWLGRVSQSGPRQEHGPGDHGHGAGHPEAGGGAEGRADPAELVATFRSGGAELVQVVRAFRDEQLDSYPPATPELTDGSRTLGQVIDFVIEDLAGHMRYLNEALATRPGALQEAT
jgi:hypothetical protein